MLQNDIFQRLIDLGYKRVKSFNGKPYEGNDNFFCVQAPTLYLLYINGEGKARIEKIGKDSFTAICSTEVKSVSDVNKLHEELNKIILQSDKTSLKNELSTGCMLTIIALITFLGLWFI